MNPLRAIGILLPIKGKRSGAPEVIEKTAGRGVRWGRDWSMPLRAGHTVPSAGTSGRRVRGAPFWGDCRFYDCVRERGVEHCGECLDFPCDYFMRTYDPKEGLWRVFYRIGQLVYRGKIGTEKWVEEKKAGLNPDPKYAQSAG